MSLIRAILNNGFFFLVLIVATAVYLAYSDNIKRDHGMLTNDLTSMDEHPNANPQTKVKTQEQPLDSAANKANTREPETLPGLVTASDKSDDNVIAQSDTLNNQPTVAESTQENSVHTQKTEAQPTEPETSQLAENITVSNEPSINEESNNQPLINNSSTAEATIKQKSADSVLTVELDSILNEEKLTDQLPQFSSQQEALSAAQQASSKQEHLTAAHIYFDIITKAPSANMVGAFALSLSQAGKKEWAEKAWLISAKMLVAENRMPEAHELAARLAVIAPKVSQEIHMNLQKIHQARMLEQQQKMLAQMQKPFSNSKPLNHQNMPPMGQPNRANLPPMQPMPHMAPMPNYAPMKPMQPMPQMQPMVQQYRPNMPPMQPMPQMARMPNYAPMKPMQPIPQMQPMAQQYRPNMPPMQPIPQMAPMPNYAPMKPMQPMPQMGEPQNSSAPVSQFRPAYPNSRFVAMPYPHQARYQAYLVDMRRKNSMMQNRMPTAIPPQFRPNPNMAF